MSSQPGYWVISQVPTTDWDDAAGQAVAGWRVTVRDAVTGTVVPVFVPEELHDPDAVHTLIQQKLDTVRAVADLGSGPPAPAPTAE